MDHMLALKHTKRKYDFNGLLSISKQTIKQLLQTSQ